MIFLLIIAILKKLTQIWELPEIIQIVGSTELGEDNSTVGGLKQRTKT